MIKKTKKERGPGASRAVWSWALYDAGNSAFATVVMAGFFPVFFKTFWSSTADVTVSTARLGLANAAAGLTIALLAPLLGAIVDCSGTSKKFLGFFAGIGISAGALLFFVGPGRWPAAAALYVLAVVGFSGANVFYDSLLPSVAGKHFVDRVSSLGFALGYLGGGVLFALCVWMTLRPQTFGLAPANIGAASGEQARRLLEAGRTSAISLSFLLTAAWWAAFTLPLLLFVPEPAAKSARKFFSSVRRGASELVNTFREVRRMKPVWLFLLAYWFYIDGVNTIIRMAVDYGLSLGFSSVDLIGALLVTQLVGFPCTLLFGRLAERCGPKNALAAAIAGYLVIVLWGMGMRSRIEFYGLAVMVGFFQGGVQALSRSYFTRLIPRGRSSQFFGFYNMVGKWSAILGPALVAVSGTLTRSPRAGIASIALFFIVGGAILFFVEENPAADTPACG